jgi:hypothetical protein
MFCFSINKSVNRTEKYYARFSPFVMNPVFQKLLGNFHVFRFFNYFPNTHKENSEVCQICNVFFLSQDTILPFLFHNDTEYLS